MSVYTRIVPTFMEDTKKNNEILNSVISQMSDGMWENNPRYNGYWTFAIISENLSVIKVSEKPCEWSTWNGRASCLENPYTHMDDKAIRKFFANKIKAIARENLKDEYIDNIYKKFYEIWGLDESYRYVYPTKKKDDIAMANKQIEEYLEKHPFALKGLFNEKNDTEVIYLSYEEKVTVADAYRAYQSLIS